MFLSPCLLSKPYQAMAPDDPIFPQQRVTGRTGCFPNKDLVVQSTMAWTLSPLETHCLRHPRIAFAFICVHHISTMALLAIRHQTEFLLPMHPTTKPIAASPFLTLPPFLATSPHSCDPGMSILHHISNIFGHPSSSSFRSWLDNHILTLAFAQL